MGKLEGKVALVTGGNSGIGLASAKLFAEEGASVIITGRRADAVDDAVSQIGHDAIGFVGDVTDLDAHDRLVELIVSRFGKLDVYFANAGVITLTNFQDATTDIFDETFAINVRGTYFGIQKALPILVDGGSIIMTGSIASYVALDAHNVYAASKAAVRSFARSWAKDLRDRKIRVNVLSPGPVRTPIIEKAGGDADEMERAVADLIPLGRLGRSEELATAALFPASDDSSFVNGIELSVDGGMAQI